MSHYYVCTQVSDLRNTLYKYVERTFIPDFYVNDACKNHIFF